MNKKIHPTIISINRAYRGGRRFVADEDSIAEVLSQYCILVKQPEKLKAARGQRYARHNRRSIA